MATNKTTAKNADAAVIAANAQTDAPTATTSLEQEIAQLRNLITDGSIPLLAWRDCGTYFVCVTQYGHKFVACSVIDVPDALAPATLGAAA